MPCRRDLRASLILALVLFVAAAAAEAKKKKPKDAEDLFNPLLGVEYSHWLVGPVFEMADGREIDQYLALTSDDEASAFIDAFWAERSQGTDFFQKTPRQIFDQRSEEADKRFSEGTYPGRRTDRGTILILYGEPEEIDFESSKKLGGPTLEVWKYPKDAEEGLDGKEPKTRYRFARVGERTVLYTGQALRPDLRKRLRQRN